MFDAFEDLPALLVRKMPQSISIKYCAVPIDYDRVEKCDFSTLRQRGELQGRDAELMPNITVVWVKAIDCTNDTASAVRQQRFLS
jgi:hypothetical protein